MAIGTYVLVHGAWHGGWCWAKVARLLRDAAQDVYTPTLTGLGERAHLARPEIDLETHIQDVVAVIEGEELRGVTLVGHSYGGMVISGVAPGWHRISQLVYLDAFVPEAGKALLDYLGDRAAAHARGGRHAGEGWKLPSFPPERFGVTSQRDTEWLTRHLVPQPLKTFEQPLPAAGGENSSERTSTARTTRRGPSVSSPSGCATIASGRSTTSAGHDAMVTAPGEIAKILMAK